MIIVSKLLFRFFDLNELFLYLLKLISHLFPSTKGIFTVLLRFNT